MDRAITAAARASRGRGFFSRPCRQGQPGQGLFQPSLAQERQDEHHRQHQNGGEDDLPGDLDVLTGHLGGFAEDQQVAGEDGVAAGHELPVLGPAKEQAHRAGNEIGQPGPTEGRIEQQKQQHEGDKIQHQHHGLGKIPGEQGRAMVTGGEEQAHKTQEAAARQEQQPGHDLHQPGTGLFYRLFRHRDHLGN